MFSPQTVFVYLREAYLVPNLLLPVLDVAVWLLLGIFLLVSWPMRGKRVMEPKAQAASLEAWGSRTQTRWRVSGVRQVQVASEPVVAISIVAKSYHGPSEQSSLGSLTPSMLRERLLCLTSNRRIQIRVTATETSKTFAGFYMIVLLQKINPTSYIF